MREIIRNNSFSYIIVFSMFIRLNTSISNYVTIYYLFRINDLPAIDEIERYPSPLSSVRSKKKQRAWHLFIRYIYILYSAGSYVNKFTI